MKVTAIVPAAGLGLRFKSNIPKPLNLINGEPIIIHTLKILSSHSLISDIIIVFNAQGIPQIKELVSQEGIEKVSDIVEGGPTRKHSVKNGLKYLKDTDLVLIHDGVRPFLEHKIITNVIEAADKYNAAVVGVPVKSTIKRINLKDLEIDCTLRRNEIWEIQTPQVFSKDLILRAYSSVHNLDEIEAPDDAFLVERLGHRIVLVLGSYLNIKITTPEDMVLAEAINKINKDRPL